MYRAAIVHLAHVHHLLAAANCDILGVLLVHQRLVGGLDRVHGVLGAGHADGNVVEAGGAAHFKDARGAAETKA